MSTENNSQQPPLLATPEDYSLIFESSRIGQKIYADLLARFGRIPSNSSGIDRILDQFQYAGQRKVIEFITLRINQANGVQENEYDTADRNTY